MVRLVNTCVLLSPVLPRRVVNLTIEFVHNSCTRHNQELIRLHFQLYIKVNNRFRMVK